MKVFLAHNYYQQAGGEDKVFSSERCLMTRMGIQVIPYTISNNIISQTTKLQSAGKTFWNWGVYQNIRSIIQQERPDIAHFHNTFPLLSPSGYEAANSECIPVVQTLHNYRLFCLNALFLKNSAVCQDCMSSRFPIKGVLRRCYRGSTSASLVTASMLAFHWAKRTWQTRVDCYIALSEFARQTFINGGLPAEKIVVKPNFVYPDPGVGTGARDYALFVGRLSSEKGIQLLLKAWEQLHGQIPLKIVGDGPEADTVKDYQQCDASVEWLGRRTNDEVTMLMQQARVLLLPSICFENFPMTLGEAFATGTPVIASDIGSLHSLVEHEKTGLLFQPGDADDLAAKVSQMWADQSLCAEMGRCARAEYESKYTAEENYRQLMAIYQMAIENHRKG